jgi:Na+-driven multidrug efflux pump
MPKIVGEAVPKQNWKQILRGSWFVVWFFLIFSSALGGLALLKIALAYAPSGTAPPTTLQAVVFLIALGLLAICVVVLIFCVLRRPPVEAFTRANWAIAMCCYALLLAALFWLSRS